MELYSCGSTEVLDSMDTRARDLVRPIQSAAPDNEATRPVPLCDVLHAQLDLRRRQREDGRVVVERVHPSELLTCVCDAPHPLLQLGTEEYPRCSECCKPVRGLATFWEYFWVSFTHRLAAAHSKSGSRHQ